MIRTQSNNIVRVAGRSLQVIFIIVLMIGLTSCKASFDAGKYNLLDPAMRDREPQIAEADYETFLDGNRQFSFDLYHQLNSGEGNILFSPYSISTAFAILYAGAGETTEQEIAEVMRFAKDQDIVHSSFNQLDLGFQELESRPAEKGKRKFQLFSGNSIWMGDGIEIYPEYIEKVQRNYDAMVAYLPLSPQEAKKVTDSWIEFKTNGMLKDGMDPADFADAILVILNAIYFKASWETEFEKNDTMDASFDLLDGTKIKVPTMRAEGSFRSSKSDGVTMIELPYSPLGSASMLIIQPDLEIFAEIEAGLGQDMLDSFDENSLLGDVELYMPKFEFESAHQLTDTLKVMGINDAFIHHHYFTGISPDCLVINNVLHKAKIIVDEEGTEAAAFTAIVLETDSISLTPTIRIDSPFLFMIRDDNTGSILFMGRVLNPAS